MEKHVSDISNPKSKTLAAKHFQKSWINEDPCYTCHTNYSMFGDMEAKLHGLRHMWVGISRPNLNEDQIKIYKPYPDSNCLKCHDNRWFAKVEEHVEAAPEERCLDCHEKIHPRTASKEETEKEL